MEEKKLGWWFIANTNGGGGGSIVYPETSTIMRIDDREVISAEPISENTVEVTFKDGETEYVGIEQDPETGAYRITADNIMFCFNNNDVGDSHNGAELFAELIKAWYNYLS